MWIWPLFIFRFKYIQGTSRFVYICEFVDISITVIATIISNGDTNSLSAAKVYYVEIKIPANPCSLKFKKEKKLAC